MNTESNQEEIPAGKTAKEQILEQHEVPEVLDFLKENGVAIVVGAAIAVGAFVGYSVWKNNKETQQTTASTMLANSQTIPQFQEIINNYGNTLAAPMATLSLAAAYYDQGQYDLARHTFIQFQTTYADHDMLPVADLGVAQSFEAAGSFADAIAGYDSFLTRYPNHYLAPSAVFGKARILESQGRFDESRAVYEDFIAANPESRWTGRAETGLEFVKKQQRAAAMPKAPEAAVSPVEEIAPAVEPVVEEAVVPEASETTESSVE